MSKVATVINNCPHVAVIICLLPAMKLIERSAAQINRLVNRAWALIRANRLACWALNIIGEN